MTLPDDIERGDHAFDSRSWQVVQVRLEQPSDESSVQTLVADAFGGSRVANLLATMRADHCWLGLSFIAEGSQASRGVVGHVCYTRAWVDAPSRLIEVLVLSPLSVRTDAQRQGIGTALIDRSIDYLKGQRREPLIFLEGDPGYYRNRGFAEAESRGFVRPSLRIPSPAFQVMALRDYPRDVYGTLIYPDVFWRHDAVGLR